MKRGFTLIELLISVAIFVIMTALVVANYGNFNTSTLLTDTAYNVALVLRTAQTFGLSVKNATAGQTEFSYPYGVDFNVAASSGGSCAGTNSFNTLIVFFADSEGTGACGSTDTLVNTYTLTRGASVSGLCAGTGSVCTTSAGSVTQLDITYLRPNPEAKICVNGLSSQCGYTYAQITIQGSDKSTRSISVYENGQISVNKQ